MQSKSVIIQEILNPKLKDHYIIFYSEWCPFSMDAIELLTNTRTPYISHIIDTMRIGHTTGDLKKLLSRFKQYKDVLKFNEKHSTRPIIFYNGKFIGGYQELKKHLESRI